MPPLNFHDQKHLTRMFVQEQRVNALFNELVRNISPELRKWKEYNHKSVWLRNSAIEKRIELHLLNFKTKLEKEIKTNQSKAWNDAVKKNDNLVEKYIQGMSLSSMIKDGMFKRNLDALIALQNRVENGFSLSDRVWSIAKQTKGHIEMFLESGLSTGRSAEEIGRDIRQLLQKPDKRFRRIRDKDGNLVLSEPMKGYNPGQGVYRSSRMNAIRLTATEINMGYRVSDSERWKQLDFVLGYEIKRSPNAKPCAICDAMVGKYPKDFVFSAFHPFCICFGIPILMNHDDFADYIVNDTISTDKYVKDIPQRARGFINKNPNYLKKSYYGKLNKVFFSGNRGDVNLIRGKLGEIRRTTGGKAFIAFGLFSPIIYKNLAKAGSTIEKQKLLKSITKSDQFKPLLIDNNTGARTVMHPLHKGSSSKRWKETKQMAKELNANGIDVCFLPEYADKMSADAITLFKNRYTIVDFKYSASKNWNTLAVDLIRGFEQCDTIVLKLDKMDLGQFRKSIEYIKRNGQIGNIKLINKYGNVFELERRELNSGKYINKIRGKL